MSLKAILYGILTVLLFYGLLALTVFLFALDWKIGIVGIILLIVIPPIPARKAYSSTVGILDRLLLKFGIPVLMLLGIGAALLYSFLP